MEESDRKRIRSASQHQTPEQIHKTQQTTHEATQANQQTTTQPSSSQGPFKFSSLTLPKLITSVVNSIKN